MDKEARSSKWIKYFVIYVIGSLLCPNTHPRTPLKYASMFTFEDMKEIHEYNWCKHVIEHFNNGMATMESTTYLQVDLHLLMIVICQKFSRKPKEIVDGVPLCSMWGNVDARNEWKYLKSLGGGALFRKSALMPLLHPRSVVNLSDLDARNVRDNESILPQPHADAETGVGGGDIDILETQLPSFDLGVNEDFGCAIIPDERANDMCTDDLQFEDCEVLRRKQLKELMTREVIANIVVDNFCEYLNNDELKLYRRWAFPPLYADKGVDCGFFKWVDEGSHRDDDNLARMGSENVTLRRKLEEAEGALAIANDKASRRKREKQRMQQALARTTKDYSNLVSEIKIVRK
ncbi:hypothetical protein LINPERHAP2_LOCUS40177 [Linum perenne]